MREAGGGYLGIAIRHLILKLTAENDLEPKQEPTIHRLQPSAESVPFSFGLDMNGHASDLGVRSVLTHPSYP